MNNRLLPNTSALISTLAALVSLCALLAFGAIPMQGDVRAQAPPHNCSDSHRG